jgi:outer membrane immunogenic protein
MSKVKTLLLATASSVAIAGGAAAADLPLKAPAPVAPIWNWSGFNVGVHLGGGWSRTEWLERSHKGDICLGDLDGYDFYDSFFVVNDSTNYSNCVLGGAFSTPTDPNFLGRSFNRGSTQGMGVLGGVQAGWLYQAPGSRFVWGVEGQYSFANIKGDHGDSVSTAGSLVGFGDGGNSNAAISGSLNERFATKIDGVGTLAFKFGYAAFDNRVLFFGKVGGAYAHEKYSLSSQFSLAGLGSSPGGNHCSGGGDVNCSQPSDSEGASNLFSLPLNGTGSWSGSQSRWGGMVGAGLAFFLTPDVTAKVEYNYLWFGKKDVTLNGSMTATLSCVNISGTAGCDQFGDNLPSTITTKTSRTFSTKPDIQLIKFGIDYHFTWLGKDAPAPVYVTK